MRCPANICPMILLCVVQSLYCRAEARRLLQERQGTTNMGGAQSKSSMLRFSIVGRMERGQRAARRKGEENVEQCWPRLTCHVATLSGKYVSLWRSNQQYQGIGKLQPRGFSFRNERQVPTGIKSLQPVIEINIKLLWVVQAFTSRHGQTGFPGQLFHILYQSKQLDIPPSWCPRRKRHDITPKREITEVSKHAYHPFWEELASEMFQCLHHHELA